MLRHATEDIASPDTAAAKARPTPERPDVTGFDIATLQRRLGNAAVAELLGADREPPQHSTTGTQVQRFVEGQAERPTATRGRSRARPTPSVTVSVTDNGAFAIVPGADHIWVRDGSAGGVAPSMRTDRRRPTSMRIGDSTYTRYRLARVKILQDCLHAAEEIINNKVDELDYGEGEYSRVDVRAGKRRRSENFGESLKKMRLQAGKAARPRNHRANPQAGEAFVIITKDQGEREMSPYHAAAVVARDGQDCITLEVFATDADEPTKASPTARGYTVGSAELSFHGHWTTAYFEGTGPITVVIQPHPDHRG